MNLLPSDLKDNPMDALAVLKDVADALSAVLSSSDDELLNAPDVRAGFSYIASAMRESLGIVSDLVWQRIQKEKALEKERDQLRTDLTNTDFVARHYQKRMEEAEASAQGSIVPDLTEPVPIPDHGMAAAG